MQCSSIVRAVSPHTVGSGAVNLASSGILQYARCYRGNILRALMALGSSAMFEWVRSCYLSFVNVSALDDLFLYYR